MALKIARGAPTPGPLYRFNGPLASYGSDEALNVHVDEADEPSPAADPQY